MLTEFEREELDRLTATVDKRAQLEDQKDLIRSRSLQLTREVNRCEAVTALFASQQFQAMLTDASALTQEFQTVLEDYTSVPARKDLLIERLQAGNMALEAQVWGLKQRIQDEHEREDRLEASMQACDQSLSELVDKKVALENEVAVLNREVEGTKERRKAFLEGLFSMEGLSQEEQQFLHLGQLDRLTLHLTRDSKESSNAKTNILVKLTERLFHLQHLRTQHESAQRLFSNYSSCQSEQDLINEEQALALQIAATQQRINEERQGEERAEEDCKGKVKAEASRQAQQWVRKRLTDLVKKRNMVHACLEMMVPGNEDEFMEVRELESELQKLEQEETSFRQRVTDRDVHL